MEEYSTTPRPHSTPLAQSRITQKILSKQGDTKLDSNADEPDTSANDERDESVSSSTTLPPDSPPMKASPPVPGGPVTIYPNAENITAETLDKHMYTAENPPLDLFIRTSGVERLSDFMLWQCHQDTQVFFLKCLWPEFDLWHFLPVLVEWQWRQKQKEREERPRRRGTKIA